MEPQQDSAPISTDDVSRGDEVTLREAGPSKNTQPGTYDLMVIIPATQPDEAIPGIKEKLRVLITEHGATVSGDEDLGKRKLAYPIEHIRQGFYHLYRLDMPRPAIKKMDQALRLQADVLRHLLTIRTVKSQEQLQAEAALRERIQAKRMAAEERAVADKVAKEAEERSEKAAAAAEAAPKREVSPEELEKKLSEILTDETMGE